MIRTITVTGVALILVAAGAALAEDDGWSGDVSLAFSQQSGTTETVSGTFDAKAERDWESDEVDLRVVATLGTSEERDNSRETTQNTQAFFGGWKHIITERFFIDSQSEVSRDGTQDRDLRLTLSTGPGYRAWIGEDPGKEHFDVSAGLGYRYEIFDGNRNNAGAEKSNDNFVDVVAAFEYKNLLFDGRVEYTHTGSARMPANDPNAYLLRTEITGAVPLSEVWDLRIGFLAEYQKVTTGRNKELTTRTTIGLGYKF